MESLLTGAFLVSHEGSHLLLHPLDLASPAQATAQRTRTTNVVQWEVAVEVLWAVEAKELDLWAQAEEAEVTDQGGKVVLLQDCQRNIISGAQ